MQNMGGKSKGTNTEHPGSEKDGEVAQEPESKMTKATGKNDAKT